MTAGFVAVVVTCLVGITTYAGAITTFGLVAYVLPVTVICLLAGRRFREPLAGGVFGVGLLALALAEIVNLVLDSSVGPGARSSFLAGGSAGVAAVLASSRWPALFLAPVGTLVGGALALGAATEVRGPVIATTVSALVALGLLEGERRHVVGPARPHLAAAVLCLAAAGLASAAAITLQHDRQTRDPYSPFPGSVRAEIAPLRTRPTPSPTPTPSASPTATPTPAPFSDTEPGSGFSAGALLRVLGALLLAPLLIGVARLRSALSWRRARRRLRDGTPREAVAGAWRWAAARRATLGRPLPLQQSPDRVPSGDEGPHWAELATIVSQCTFSAGAPSTAAAERAWALADEAWLADQRSSPGARRFLADVRSARGLNARATSN